MNITCTPKAAASAFVPGHIYRHGLTGTLFIHVTNKIGQTWMARLKDGHLFPALLVAHYEDVTNDVVLGDKQ